MNPKLWGPALWVSLMYMVLNYPHQPGPDMKKRYQKFFGHLGGVLPCENCHINYEKFLKTHPVQNSLQSRDHLFSWLLLLHNQSSKTSLNRAGFLNRYRTYGTQFQGTRNFSNRGRGSGRGGRVGRGPGGGRGGRGPGGRKGQSGGGGNKTGKSEPPAVKGCLHCQAKSMKFVPKNKQLSKSSYR